MTTGLTPSLLGRSRVLSLLDSALDPSEDHDRCLLLLGEPGIGKTAVLSVVAGSAREAGALVLASRGVAAEQPLPFAGLHQLLSPLISGAGSLPAVQRAALEAAFGLTDSAPPQMFVVALAAWGLVTRAALERAVVILIDDVHWIDALSQAVFAFLARRVVDQGVVLVSAARSGYDGALVGLGEVLELAPLTPDEASELLLGRHPALDVATRQLVLSRARGNPLALLELARASGRVGAFGGSGPQLRRVGTHSEVGTAPLSRRLGQAFAGSLRSLPGPTQTAVVVAAAYAGTDVSVVTAATSRMCDAPVTLADLEPAVGAGLITLTQTRVEFVHPLVRTAVLNGVAPSRTLATHAALAATLGRDPLARAWHRAHATVPADDTVAEELESAASLALGRGSTEQAVRCLERSAELTADPRLRGRRFAAAAVSSVGLDQPAATATLVARATELPVARLDQLRLDWVREVLDDNEPGGAHRVHLLCEQAGEAGTLGDRGLALDLLLAAAVRCWWSDPGVAARTEVFDGLQNQAVPDDPRCLAALAVADPVGAATSVSELLARFEGVRITDVAALRLLGVAAYAIGDSPRSAGYLRGAEAELRRGGGTGQLIQVLVSQAGSRLMTGDWNQAEAALDEAQRLGGQINQPGWDTALLVCRARSAALRGDLTVALELAGRAELVAAGRRVNPLLAGVQLAKGCAWASVGRFSEAYAELRRMFDPGQPCYQVPQCYPAIMFLAESAAHSGHRTDARMILEPWVRIASATDGPDLKVHTGYARAVLADDDEAEALYRAALSSDLHQWPFVRAMVESAFGAWLRRQRRIAESRRPLRSALITFDLIGARGWAARARSELAAAGERQETPAQSPHEVLSPQQLQIAHLVARGLSNREIGEQLSLSPRTVGSHLYRIFPKLGVASRIQLVNRLNQLTPGTPGTPGRSAGRSRTGP